MSRAIPFIVLVAVLNAPPDAAPDIILLASGAARVPLIATLPVVCRAQLPDLPLLSRSDGAQATEMSDTGQVPSVLLLRAAEAPIVLTMLLAHARIPSGLEVRVSDQTPRGEPDFQFEREPLVPADTLAVAFNAHHKDYHAEISDGVFVIRPTVGRSAYLDSESSLGRTRVVGLMNAARKVFASLDPRLGLGGAIAGSVAGDAAQTGEFVQVVLEGRGRTQVDVLNQIVKQSSRGWIVVTSDDVDAPRVLKFGFMNREGTAIYQPISDRTPGAASVPST